MVIVLKRDDFCADCGAKLAAGTKAKWYRSGKVYGLTCHPKRNVGTPTAAEPTSPASIG